MLTSSHVETAGAVIPSETDLGWPIIALAAVIVLEVIILALRKRARGKNKSRTEKSKSFALSALLAAITPLGAIPIIIAEVVAIVGLGIWIDLTPTKPKDKN